MNAKDAMSNAEQPKQLLIEGAEILSAVLKPHGFEFKLEKEGKGSGGHFATGSFRKHDRVLEFHFRYSLGLVTYHIGDSSIEHETYMRLLGVYGRNRSPDFPEKPLDSFHYLAEDIEKYCSDFVFGDGQKFLRLAAEFRKNPAMFKGIV
jgi:hypothetical protein